jgi:uncharacterized linocin/CFP29 family protein
MAEVNWNDAQWQKVNDAVTEAFGKASVASAFLPLYGPLPGSAETVRNDRLIEDSSRPITVRLDGDHDAANLKLVNLTVKVELTSEQVADDTLSNAMLAFRRAANILAQEEDRIVFDGFDRGDANSLFVVNKIKPQKGLADLVARRRFADWAEDAKPGPALVSAVVAAIRTLEDDSNPAPFACVLGNRLFERAHDPSDSLVLPADRITPLLKGGPLLRSGKMDKKTGIVVSLAAAAVDIVVGTPPTVQFLQRTQAARFLFRVYERFALRIRDKEKPPVAGFTIRSSATRVEQAKTLETLAEAETLVPQAELALATANKELAEAQQALDKAREEERTAEPQKKQAAQKAVGDAQRDLDAAKKKVSDALERLEKARKDAKEQFEAVADAARKRALAARNEND